MAFKRAIVTGVGPLQILIDGDTAPIPFTPESGIDPATLAVGDVVRTVFSGNQLLVVYRMWTSAGPGSGPGYGRGFYGHGLYGHGVV